MTLKLMVTKVTAVRLEAGPGCDFQEGLREAMAFALFEWTQVEYRNRNMMAIIDPNKMQDSVVIKNTAI